MLTPNRVVAVLTPLLFAPLAGTIAALLAQHFPGVNVDKSSIEQVFIGGALIALAPALQWLHGWQKFEARQEAVAHDLAHANAEVAQTSAAATLPELEEPSDLDALDELEEPTDLEDSDDLDELEESALTTDGDELDELEELSRATELDDLDDRADLDDLEGLGDFDEEPAPARF